MPRIELAMVNDNVGAALPSVDRGQLAFGQDTSPLSGNDVGYTAGFSLSVEERDTRGALRASLISDLFTRATGRSWTRADGRLIYEQDAVDLTQLMLESSRQLTPALRLQLGVTAGLRNGGAMMAIQRAWHTAIPAYIPEHRTGPMDGYLGASAGLRAEQRAALGPFGLTLGAQTAGSACGGCAEPLSLRALGQVDAALDLTRLRVDGAYQLSATRQGVASEASLGAAVPVGAITLSGRAILRSGAINDALKAYDDDTDLLIRLGIGF